MNTTNTPTDMLAQLCRQLHDLAKAEENAASHEAARVPYWAACPPSVTAHREAARSLRATAHSVEARIGIYVPSAYPAQLAG